MLAAHAVCAEVVDEVFRSRGRKQIIEQGGEGGLIVLWMIDGEGGDCADEFAFGVEEGFEFSR